jgi:hypothetical protein
MKKRRSTHRRLSAIRLDAFIPAVFRIHITLFTFAAAYVVVTCGPFYMAVCYGSTRKNDN